MPFSPVKTLEELDTLDGDAVVEGYVSAERGDPEPGENRGKAFWHGWRNRMIDYVERNLVRELHAKAVRPMTHLQERG